MTAVCSRVTEPSGSKRPLPIPATTPFSAAQVTASVYHVPSGTSSNVLVPFGAGSPASRHSTDTSIARVMVISGAKVVAVVPAKRPLL